MGGECGAGPREKSSQLLAASYAQRAGPAGDEKCVVVTGIISCYRYHSSLLVEEQPDGPPSVTG